MSFFARFAQNRGALVGLIILMAIILMAILAPLLFPESPWRMVQRPFLPPLTGFGKPRKWNTRNPPGRKVGARPSEAKRPGWVPDRGLTRSLRRWQHPRRARIP